MQSLLQLVASAAHTCTQLSKGSRANHTHNLSNESVQVSVVLGCLCVHESRGGASHHVAGLLQAGFVASRRHTVLSMSVTQATAFHNKIIDGVMFRGQRGSATLLRLTRTRLTLQEADSQVGDHQAVLGSRSEGIHLVRRRQSSVDHLEIAVKFTITNPKASGGTRNHFLLFLFMVCQNKQKASGCLIKKNFCDVNMDQRFFFCTVKLVNSNGFNLKRRDI